MDYIANNNKKTGLCILFTLMGICISMLFQVFTLLKEDKEEK